MPSATAVTVLPAVANMSLGGGASLALDTAVLNSASAGIFYAVAAGNSGADACQSSPARAGAGTDNGVMTTAATDSADKEAAFSNYGSCVDIWAPGVGVLSTKKGGGTTTLVVDESGQLVRHFASLGGTNNTCAPMSPRADKNSLYRFIS